LVCRSDQRRNRRTQGFFRQLQIELSDAIRVYVRYDVKDETGETRRERNERFGKPELSPPLRYPDAGAYLWGWYFDLSQRLRRVRDGVCEPIPPSEYEAWARLTDNIVYPHEYAILAAMDAAYCEEMNKELAAYHERLKDQAASDSKPRR
jgi:hypothetical protein